MGKSKYNNVFKFLTIEKGYLGHFLDKKKECHKEDIEIALNDHLGIVDTRTIGVNWFNYLNIDVPNDNFLDCARRLTLSKKSKVSRASRKIEDIITCNDNSVFLTLTFTDNVLESTSAETRRRYVARFLKNNCKSYVANIDFSPVKGREHYHAVIDSPINTKEWTEKYGFVFTERIRTHTTPRKVANYINKLTLHAFKVDNAPRLIYSRT